MIVRYMHVYDTEWRLCRGGTRVSTGCLIVSFGLDEKGFIFPRRRETEEKNRPEFPFVPIDFSVSCLRAMFSFWSSATRSCWTENI